eukprot:scaffold539_cov145-Skeletonema_menzelii.AAC.6
MDLDFCRSTYDKAVKGARRRLVCILNFLAKSTEGKRKRSTAGVQMHLWCCSLPGSSAIGVYISRAQCTQQGLGCFNTHARTHGRRYDRDERRNLPYTSYPRHWSGRKNGIYDAAWT